MHKRRGREVGEGRSSRPGVGEEGREECKGRGREVGGVEKEEGKGPGREVGVGWPFSPEAGRGGRVERARSRR